MEKGIKHLNNNEVAEAEILFRKAISESPEFGLPYKYLGNIMHSDRDLVKAVETTGDGQTYKVSNVKTGAKS